MLSFGAVAAAHRIISEFVKPGDLCIDATAGRGNDAAFLCELVGKEGKVLAFDIQKEAVESTKALLEKRGLGKICEVILDSHENMDRYVEPGSVSCITFNFGYLPGGDHRITTKPYSSIAAVKKGLGLLKKGGLMSLCIYYGRDTGFEERDALLSYLKTIDYKQHTAWVCEFVNRPNCPPIPAFIFKH